MKKLNIGIDFDGVIVDSERIFRYIVEKLYYFKYGRKPRTRRYRQIQKCFPPHFTSEMLQLVMDNIKQITQDAPILPGAVEILKMLRAHGHKLFLVTARGIYDEEKEIDCTLKRLNKLGIEFDGFFWKASDKTKVCLENNIDVIIDDCDDNCTSTAAAGIKTLFFRDKTVRKLPKKPCLIEVDNWMHIYTEIISLS